MKKIILISLFTLLLSGCSTITNNTDQAELETTQTAELEMLETSDNTDVNLNSMYIEYSNNQYKNLKGNEPFALYFHADWCPNCQKLNSELTTNQKQLTAKILKTNFDTETELKKEYGVNMQTTFVIFNSNGEVSTKLSNPTLEEVNNALKQV